MDVVEGRIYLGENGIKEACIGIEDGRIVKIKKMLEGDKHHHFGSNIVIPAGVDIHVHFREPGDTRKEDFASGSLAALYGGVTTVVDMPNNRPPAVDTTSLADKFRTVERRSFVDFGLYCGLNVTTDVGNVAKITCGFKHFFGPTTAALEFNEHDEIAKRYDAVAKTGKNMPVAVHAEDGEILAISMKRHHYKRGDLTGHDHARPPEAEARAIARIGKIMASLPAGSMPHLHFCHVSSEKGLEAARDVRSRFGERVTMEFTPHHLLLDHHAPVGAYGKVNPPLRSDGDRAALWDALRAGECDVIASDHAPHLPEEKESDEPPSGIPGVETMLPLLLYRTKMGDLDLDTLVRCCSTNPARIMNFNKGEIAVGRDADLLVFDPSDIVEIKGEKIQSRCGWTPYEGHSAIYPEAVFLRGELVVKEGNVYGTRGTGNYLNGNDDS